MKLNNYCVIMNLYCGLTGGLYCHAYVHAYYCIINFACTAHFKQLTFVSVKKIICVMENVKTILNFFCVLFCYGILFYSLYCIKHCSAFMFVQSPL